MYRYSFAAARADNNDDDDDRPLPMMSSSSRRRRTPRRGPDDDDDDDADRRHRHHHHLPRQSTLTTRILFETIAPHVELRTLTKLTRKIKSSLSSSMKNDAYDTTNATARHDGDDDAIAASTWDGRRETALDGTLDAMFGRGDAVGSTARTTTTTSSSLVGHSWMRRTLRAYFMGGRLDRPTRSNDRHITAAMTGDERPSPPATATSSLRLPHETDPTYPPNRNRERRRDEDLDALMDARDVRVYRHPIRWTTRKKPESNIIGYEERIRERHRGKDNGRLLSEAEDLLEALASSLPPTHFDKLMGRLGAFARLDDGAIGPTSSSSSRDRDVDVSGGWYVDNDGSSSGLAAPLPELSPSSAAANADYKKHGIPNLAKFLKECSDSHSHLVAPALAKFFYVDVGDGKEVVAADLAVVGPGGAMAEQRVLGKKHRRLNTMTEKKYDKARDEFVKKMMGLQHEFASWDGCPARVDEKFPENTKKVANERSGVRTGLENVEYDDNGDDVSSDLLVKEFLKTQEPYSAESRKEQREEVKGTLEELRLIGQQNDELRAENKMKGRGRPRTETNVLSEDRLIFINNLPIDVSEEEIDEIYSRCGPLDSIQLFNLRPDLDPGPMTNKQQRERRLNKKLRNKNSFAKEESPHHRPRSPVYGILRFLTDEGYRIATSQELCIFGCVIRRHPVLSIKPHDMDTLYLENIPTDMHSIDLENKLARSLRPHRVHIMLDGLKGVGRNVNQEYSKPSSCQVKFSDFHTALQAYRWISDGMILDENNASIAVHWFRTPSNSIDYWTRNLGF
ncbi:hypothetical protein ACHAXA_004075 [Cyclostephanos tholiformis]|uniref:RRM domain-containing protein n=1 Tax=Cyclostephanos tholiformis TaxID=382380 RepID=A0ABD3RFZ9_9STRA